MATNPYAQYVGSSPAYAAMSAAWEEGERRKQAEADAAAAGTRNVDASTRNVDTDSDIALREMTLKEQQAQFGQQQAAQKNAALAGIASQLQTTTGYSAAPRTPSPTPAVGGGGGGAVAASPDDLAAENAGYARAKERTGLALQSALKGLRGAMAARGISGSGIEASAMGDLFSGGLGDLAETDRQLAETSAARAFTRNESEKDRAESARRYDADAAARRMSQLLSVYGSMY